jgi:glucosamine 6-phosphate synthetase-like amidotransferase/phosphosugar isomerase protein
MTDEVIVKQTRNCSAGMHPGTLTLTDRNLTFTSLLRKKVIFEVPLENIQQVEAEGLNLISIFAPEGRYRVRVNAITRTEWIETLQQAVAG